MANKVFVLLAALLLIIALAVQPAMAVTNPGHASKPAPVPGAKAGPAKPAADPPAKTGQAKPSPPPKPDPKPGPGNPGHGKNDNPCAKTGQDGSARHPWLICQPEDLALLHSRPGAYFELRSDLDMSDIEWTPVASFSGQLDGKNHVIANLETDIGLFNTIESAGKVKHLKLTDASIYSYYVGGILAAVNYGTVEHVEASGIVGGRYTLGGLVGDNYGTIRHSRVQGAVGGSNGIGGITAYNRGYILHSRADVIISGAYYTGGIAGSNEGVIAHARTDGIITGYAGMHGGIVGSNQGTVEHSHSHNDIHYYAVYTDSVGLVYGQNSGTVTRSHGHGRLVLMD